MTSLNDSRGKGKHGSKTGGANETRASRGVPKKSVPGSAEWIRTENDEKKEESTYPIKRVSSGKGKQRIFAGEKMMRYTCSFPCGAHGVRRKRVGVQLLLNSIFRKWRVFPGKGRTGSAKKQARLWAPEKLNLERMLDDGIRKERVT